MLLLEVSLINKHACPENLDDIVNLKDPDLFFSIIEKEIKSRTIDSKQKNEIDPMKDPSYIAQIISNR